MNDPHAKFTVVYQSAIPWQLNTFEMSIRKYGVLDRHEKFIENNLDILREPHPGLFLCSSKVVLSSRILLNAVTSSSTFPDLLSSFSIVQAHEFLENYPPARTNKLKSSAILTCAMRPSNRRKNRSLLCLVLRTQCFVRRQQLKLAHLSQQNTTHSFTHLLTTR